MSKDSDYGQLILRAERYLAKKNYPLAKQAFEQAAKARPGEVPREKIDQCNAGIAAKRRAELVKRGRKYDKQGKAREALECFEQALKVESEDWLLNKVAVLRASLSQDTALVRIREAEQRGDLIAALAACDEAIARGSKPGSAGAVATPGLVAKKAELLVSAGRYADLVELYQHHAADDDRGYYLFGHGLARSGQAIAALGQWLRIEAPSTALLGQIEQLLPFVVREIEAGEREGIEAAYRGLERLDTPGLETYRQYFRCKLIEQYWQEGRYAGLGELIGPLPERMPPAMLGFYAKVYMKLAQQDAAYIEPAISLWLTAVYNDQVLGSLAAVRDSATDIDQQVLRKSLLHRLQVLLESYRGEAATVYKRIQRYWEIERQLIEGLRGLDLGDAGGIAPFPCTPMFARQFGLSSALSELLKQHQERNQDQEETVLELLAYCSEAGGGLMLAEQGDSEQAIAALPRETPDPVVAYCRRRVALRLGIDKALRGEMPVKKWFQEALPLVTQYPRYTEELVKLAYDNLDPKVVAGLAEGMETLATMVKLPKFREATAHVLALHATLLNNQRIDIKSVEKLVRRALAIYPESHLATTTLRDVQLDRIIVQINKAMKQQNLAKAADIVLRSGSAEVREDFLQALQNREMHTRQWAPASRQAALHECYVQSRRIDPTHAVTRQLHDLLEHIE